MNKKMLEEYNYFTEDLKFLNQRLNDLKDLKLEEYAKIGSPNIEGAEIKNNCISDSTSNAVIKIDEYFNKYINNIYAKIEKILLKKLEVELFLEKLEVKERLIIQMRYFQNKQWKEIASFLNYTIGHIHKIHKDILKK